MKKNHYIELLKTIEKQISEKEFQKAYELISEELSMPYIPSDIEQKLKELLIDINKNLNINASTKLLPIDKIVDFILDDSTKLEAKDGLVKLLGNFNIKNNLDEIEVILLSPKVELFIKNQIIEILANNNIENTIKLSYGIKIIEFVPKLIISKSLKFKKEIQNDLTNLLIGHDLEMTVAIEMLKIISISIVLLDKTLEDYSLALTLLAAKATNNIDLINKLKPNKNDEMINLERKIKELQKFIDK